MFCDVLEQNFEEKYFEFCWYFCRRVGVYFDEDAYVFFKGNEFYFEVIKFFEETANLKELLG
jgi:hypothetical protein